MKFTHATHLLDVDGVQVTAGVTRDGEIRMLTASGNTDVARLTPELAERLAEILRDCARHARGPAPEPSGPGIRCPGCGALPDEQHREECAERDPGPVAPSPWGDRPGPEDPDRDRMDDAEMASHQAHEPEPWT